ncbi:rhomboid family intramembrane serine protease [Halorutilales archaeon Cl-col2-1]
METCDECGKEIDGIPYDCRLCGGTFCSEHRLPENHDCPNLSSYESPQTRGKKSEPSSAESSWSSAVSSLLPGLPTGLRGNATYLLLAAMVVTYLLQIVVLQVSQGLHTTVFVLTTENPLYVWTWITSIFSHSPSNPMHIFFNGIVLYFFGTFLEKRIGTRKFLGLFFVGGVVAGLAQTGVTIAQGGVGGVLGASGAVAAVLGTLTLLNPNMRIYLYFFIPMPLWVATSLFAFYEVFLTASFGAGAGGVARLAHLSGLAIGLAYGWKLRKEGYSVGRRMSLSGGRGGGGRRGGL